MEATSSDTGRNDGLETGNEDKVVVQTESNEESDSSTMSESDEETDSADDDDNNNPLHEQFAYTQVGMSVLYSGVPQVPNENKVLVNDQEETVTCATPLSSSKGDECKSQIDDSIVKDGNSLGDEHEINRMVDCLETGRDNNEGDIDDLKKYPKNVPLDPSETWDFSLQAIDKDYKSNALWIEGSFYRKFIGECLHEMHNVPCECEERKKIPVCRLCDAVFCSNQCFRQSIKIRTGENTGTVEDGTNPESEMLPKEGEPEITTELPVKGKRDDTTRVPKSYTRNAEPLPGFQSHELKDRLDDKQFDTLRQSKDQIFGEVPPRYRALSQPSAVPQNICPTGSDNVETPDGRLKQSYYTSPGRTPSKGFDNNIIRNRGTPALCTTEEPTRCFYNRGTNKTSSPSSLQISKEDWRSKKPEESVPTTENRNRNTRAGPYYSESNNIRGDLGRDQPDYRFLKNMDSLKGHGGIPVTFKPEIQFSNEYFRSSLCRNSQPTNSTLKDQSSETSSNSSTVIDEDFGQTLHFEIPYTVLMPVKYIQGNSFSDFSVMAVWNIDIYQRLHLVLQKCPKSKLEFRRNGMPCLIQYRTDQMKDSLKEWYRAIITNDNMGQVGVYLIDLGIEATVNADTLYVLPSEFFNNDPFAIRVRCLNVKANIDDPDVIEQFGTLVRESIVKIRITHLDKTRLFRHGCILSVNHLNKWFDAGVLLKKLLVGEEASKDDIRNEERKRLIMPFKSTTLKDECLPTGPTESRVSVILTHVNNYNEFFVATEKSTELKQIKHLEMLGDSYLKKKSPVRFMKHLNYPLFAWMDRNNAWHRVKVLEVVSLSSGVGALVQKVDLGDTVEVPIGELKQLHINLQTPSSCVYKCSLPIKPVSRGRGDLKSIVDELTSIKNSGDKCLLKVFSIEQHNLHIVDLSLEGSKSVLTGIVKKGIALSHNVTLDSNE